VSAQLVVRRSRSAIGVGQVFEIRVDGATAGRLKSGQSLPHELEPGEHSVQAFVANPLGDPGVDKKREAGRWRWTCATGTPSCWASDPAWPQPRSSNSGRK